MHDHHGNPRRCAGSVIHAGDLGVQVDQTPVEVVALFDGADGLVEFTYNGVSVYIDAGASITAITPIFVSVETSR